MTRLQKLLLSAASGILLSLGWPPLPFFPLLFIGFIPVLWLEDEAYHNRISSRSFFGYTYLALLIWNIVTTWWVGATYFGTNDISTAVAGLIANTANPLLMSIPVMAFHRTRLRFGNAAGYLSLPAYWITFEFIHLRWDLSWPWLSLGNGLAGFPQLIQWYEYTGALGGACWILLTNILLYRLLNVFLSGRLYLNYRRLTYSALLVLFLPVALSLSIYYSYREQGIPQNVVVVQPNIDPYGAKFDPATLQSQMQTLIGLSRQKVDTSTDYLVFPETALPDGIEISNLAGNPFIKQLQEFRAAYPGLKIITGISSYAIYQSAQTPTARKSEDGTFYWDAFNSAIQLDSTGNIPIYHKSKLVPGVEKMPYPKIFGFLESLALDMGGTSGSLGSQPYRSVFFSKSADDSIGAAALICYESIYGEYSNEYVQRGAGLLFVITNDGWWGNTAGYKQHILYGALRAIETRKDVAQSANTGTSAFINQRGDISDQTPWWEPAVISKTLHANSTQTFYVRYGDLIGRLCILISVVLAAYSVYSRIAERLRTSKSHFE